MSAAVNITHHHHGLTSSTRHRSAQLAVGHALAIFRTDSSERILRQPAGRLPCGFLGTGRPSGPESQVPLQAMRSNHLGSRSPSWSRTNHLQLKGQIKFSQNVACRMLLSTSVESSGSGILTACGAKQIQPPGGFDLLHRFAARVHSGWHPLARGLVPVGHRSEFGAFGAAARFGDGTSRMEGATARGMAGRGDIPGEEDAIAFGGRVHRGDGG